MPKIFNTEAFSPEEQVSRKDFIDKHTPFIYSHVHPKKGTPLEVRIRVGKEHSHIDDFNHFISSITLYDGENKHARAELSPCIVSAEERRGNAEVSFTIVPSKKSYTLYAQCYCTKHGTWESETVKIEVEE